MKRARGFLRRWSVRAGLGALSFVLGMALIETALVPTRWSPRKYVDTSIMDPAYRNVIGRIEKKWTPDFRKNSLALRGAEPVHPVVIALGDSCTAGCYVPERETYAGRLASKNVEVLNAGVPGYSTFQALAWVEKSKVLDYRPKLVTIYYGWNDHWRAALPECVFYWLRLAAPYSHLAAWLSLRYEDTLWNLDDTHHLFFSRVPLWEYKSNLRELIRDARDAGAVVVLITAPVEPELAKKFVAFDGGAGLPEFRDHEAYVRATREVAAETGAGLVDFAAEYEKIKTADPFEYFGDFVHPNAKGHAVLAEMLRPWRDCALASSCPPQSRYADR